MVCYLCGKSDFADRPGKVRDLEEIKVIECTSCGLVTLSRTDHISERHYEEGKMHPTEISITDWLKSTETDDLRRFEMFKRKLISKNVLDFGCGNGGFLLKSKPFTNKSDGIELEERMQPFFDEQDLQVWKSLDEAIGNSSGKYDFITSFHVFEHLSDPASVLIDLSKLLAKGGEIVIEVPSSDDALLTLYKNEAFSNFTYWSQHLFLFNQHTMVDLVKKSGLKLNWVKQVQRYGLSNHLYWLANNSPGGHVNWSFLSTKELDDAYAQQLASIGKSDTILASISHK